MFHTWVPAKIINGALEVFSTTLAIFLILSTHWLQGPFCSNLTKKLSVAVFMIVTKRFLWQTLANVIKTNFRPTLSMAIAFLAWQLILPLSDSFNTVSNLFLFLDLRQILVAHLWIRCLLVLVFLFDPHILIIKITEWAVLCLFYTVD